MYVDVAANDRLFGGRNSQPQSSSGKSPVLAIIHSSTHTLLRLSLRHFTLKHTQLAKPMQNLPVETGKKWHLLCLSLCDMEIPHTGVPHPAITCKATENEGAHLSSPLLPPFLDKGKNIELCLHLLRGSRQGTGKSALTSLKDRAWRCEPPVHLFFPGEFAKNKCNRF